VCVIQCEEISKEVIGCQSAIPPHKSVRLCNKNSVSLALLKLVETLVSQCQQVSKEDTLVRKLIERNPPPRRGFLFTVLPDQEPGGRGPPSKNLYKMIRVGSSSSGFLIRGHST